MNLLLRLVSTSFQVVLSRQIGAAGIGLLQLVMSVGALAMTAGMAGIRTATMYLTAEEIGKGRPQNVTWVLSACFLYSIFISGLIAGGLYVFAPTLATEWIGDSATVEAIRLYAGFLPVCCLCGVMTGYFTAANRIGTLAAIEVAEQFLSMGITMLLLFCWGGKDPSKACRCVIAGSGIGACLTLSCLIFFRLRERQEIGRRIPVARRLLDTAVPLALADDLKSGLSTLENLMVPKRLALYKGIADPLAAFGAVCGMVFPILMFPAAILYGLAELLIPELARCNAAGSNKRIHYLVKKSLRVAFLYGCIFGGLEFLLAKPICMVLYKNQEAGHYLRLYAVMIPMLYCDAITDAMTKGLGQQKACVRYNIITSLLDILFLFLLLPRYGMDGYLVSFLVTHLLNFILSLRRLLHIIHIRIDALVPGLALAGTTIVVYFLTKVGSVAVQAVGFLVATICLFTLLGITGKEDVLWVRNLATKKHHSQ